MYSPGYVQLVSIATHRGRPNAMSAPTGRTAEPLAHALDATLSNLMDLKISNFGHAFKNMETRLNRQRDVLSTLEQRIDEEKQSSDAMDADIEKAVQRIHALLDEKVTAEELETLQEKMAEMENYITVCTQYHVPSTRPAGQVGRS